MSVRNRFSARNPVVLDTSVEPDLAKQSMKDQCDINFIMGRYLRSGNIDWLAKHDGKYADVQPQTFHEAMNVVAKAKEMFQELPAAVRKRFGHSPQAFLEFMHDSSNIDEMRKLGLAKPAPVEPETAVARRTAELEVDAAARLELARRAVKAPEAPSTQ